MAGRARDYPIYKELTDAYDYYNKELFDNLLPECIITLSKSLNTFGVFYPMNFISVNNEDRKLHEIAMNVQAFALRQIPLTLSTLAHEMCHLKTFENGLYGRGNYHNKNWAKEMKLIGLMPSETGEPGGAETGQSVTHYIIKDDKFDLKTKELIQKGFIIPFVERIKQQVKSVDLKEARKMQIPGKPGAYKDKEGNEFNGKSIFCGYDAKGKEIIKIVVKENTTKSRVSYTCSCKAVYWGRPGGNLYCGTCKEKLRPAYGGDE
jgi:predicted SprT family Zn-dependent metalloprotease